VGPESSAGRRSRAWLVDGLLVGYLTLTGLLSLTLPDSGGLPLSHLLLTAGILGIRRWAPDIVHQLYSALLVPLLYGELDTLSGLAGGRTYDAQIVSWEKSLFGDPIPAEWFSQALPFLPLSELLHFCYLSFYPMLIFLAVRMYCLGHKKLQAYLWCSHCAYLTAYLIQMRFPVQGPRPLMPPLDESLQGPFWRLCHYLMGRGASGAAAFPSGHVTFACSIALAAWHWDHKAYRLLAPMCCGMALATIYGRFHYAVDVLVGAFIGWICMEYGPQVYQQLSNRLEKGHLEGT
jgi:membrane-associated phospholipid phosphatase